MIRELWHKYYMHANLSTESKKMNKLARQYFENVNTYLFPDEAC
jgi:hypothetical protein